MVPLPWFVSEWTIAENIEKLVRPSHDDLDPFSSRLLPPANDSSFFLTGSIGWKVEFASLPEVQHHKGM